MCRLTAVRPDTNTEITEDYCNASIGFEDVHELHLDPIRNVQENDMATY